jgi:RNA polymerase sigma factor (TIGR02999 family)
MAIDRDEITRLLQEWSSGDEEAFRQLVPIVHRELQRTARAYLGREQNANSWQPTMLVNEAYLRLVDCQRINFKDRAHFFRLAAKKMREILVDYARRKRLKKKGAGAIRVVPMEEAEPVGTDPRASVDLILLNSALEKLEAMDPRKTEIIEMRFFAGLSIEEIAASLDLAVSTIHRELQLARAWLFKTMQDGVGDEP